jgi:hypothetical protein
MIADAVEVVSVWPDLVFPDVLAASSPREGSRGLPVASLRHVLAFKAGSTREKDLREAEVIRQALRKRAVDTVLAWQEAVSAP